MRWTVGALTGVTVLVLASGCGTVPNDPNAATPAVNVTGQPGVPQPGAPQGGKPAAGRDDAAASAPTSPPLHVNVAEALQASNWEFMLLKSGNWVRAWELWTDGAKKEVPQKIFVKVNTSCPATLQREYQLQDVKAINNQLIELAFRRDDKVYHGSLRRSAKGWLFDPGNEMLAEYANGTDATIKKRKADKQC